MHQGQATASIRTAPLGSYRVISPYVHKKRLRPPTRQKELKNSLTNVKFRVSETEWEKVKEIWDALVTDRGLDKWAVPK